jgi:hypothetical protein
MNTAIGKTGHWNPDQARGGCGGASSVRQVHIGELELQLSLRFQLLPEYKNSNLNIILLIDEYESSEYFIFKLKYKMLGCKKITTDKSQMMLRYESNTLD